MKIIKLTAENVKRLKAVEITPEGPVVKITGKNAQGKTTVLDAIWWALGGSKAVQEEPIRQGETKASIRVELDDLIVTRTFTPGNTYLKVETRDGASYKSPQAVLDKLVGRLSFDPLAFARAGAKTQRALLLEVTGLAVDETQLTAIAGTVVRGETALDTLNATYKRIFDERTDVNRQLERDKARLGAMLEVEAVEPVSVSDLMARYREAQARARQVDDHEAEYTRLLDAVGALDEEIESLEARLVEAHRERHQAQARADAWKPWDRPNLDAIEQQLAQVEATNAQAQAYQARQEQLQRVADGQSETDALTRVLDGIRAYQQELVASAHFPIDGLGFANGGVTYQGVPLSQASSAEQLRVSLAMAMALNPDLRVIRIDNGSLLDSESMAIVEEMARDQDMQVWCELVAEDGAVGVYIEDGTVAAINGKVVEPQEVRI